MQQCNALQISDERRCQQHATSTNGLFCQFHSRQCQGLYRGYKSRNARLDQLNASPPPYLAEKSIALPNQNFEDISERSTLLEIHDYLFRKYGLLERVIRARKLHHSRFYALSMDYGHQTYLDKLQSDRDIVLRALERLEKRVGAVLYNQQKWFGWVRALEQEEELNRENEKKRIKREAALFKRHWAVVEARIRRKREAEKRKIQDQFLEQAYQERLARSSDDETDDEEWDPIEDVVEEDRETYVELIWSFLWQSSQVALDSEEAQTNGENTTSPVKTDQTQANCQDKVSDKESEDRNGNNSRTSEQAITMKSKSAKKKRSKAKKGDKSTAPSASEPGQTNLESPSDMRTRLREGDQYKAKVARILEGSQSNPTKLSHKTAPLDNEEIEKLISDVTEIKMLVFCRALLSRAAILPAAIRAQNVEAFLADPSVPITELRDICLKIEQPDLQDLRDACADLWRTDGDVEEPDASANHTGNTDDMDPFEDKVKPEFPLHGKKPGTTLPESWKLSREKEQQEMGDDENPEEERRRLLDIEGIEFDEIDDESQHDIKRIRVRVCGRQIYYYPSDKAMTRGGWLQFSVIAKDSSLYDAMALCRSWEEFFEVNILATFNYFPNGTWVQWLESGPRMQMLQLGFITYFQSGHAEDLTYHHQGRTHGQGPRRHEAMEFRSFMGAHIKRNDPAMRRLIQYLRMDTSKFRIVVRDAKTGKIIVAPPEEELWLCRSKSGRGRAVRNQWHVVKEVGPEFFEEIDQYRRWHLNFSEYYDVYVWDAEPGLHFMELYENVSKLLFKAHRIRSAHDFHSGIATIMKNLTQDAETGRVRDCRSDERSMWNDYEGADVRLEYRELSTGEVVAHDTPDDMLYQRSDELEDQVLFPGDDSTGADLENTAPLHNFHHGRWNMDKFISGESYDQLSSDDEEDEDSFGDESDISNEEPQSGDENVVGDEYEPFNEDRHFAMQGLSRAEGRAIERMYQGIAGIPTDHPGDDSMSEEFYTFLEAQRAKIFKEAWHRADVEPGAQSRYQSSLKTVKELRRALFRSSTDQEIAPRIDFIMSLLRQMGNISAWTRVTYFDMVKAYAAASLFFLQTIHNNIGFTDDSGIASQDQRSKQIPDRRSSHSCASRPKSFYTEWDQRLKNIEKTVKSEYIFDRRFWTEEDRCILRPIIAHLYKDGVIGASHGHTFTALPMVGREPILHSAQTQEESSTADKPSYRSPDFYLDWRDRIGQMNPLPYVVDPDTVEPILSRARRFAQSMPNARFSLLRLWSAPHFWPFTIAYDRRHEYSFTDPQGRHWEWKFIPKDIPNSDWSVHQNVSQRFKPYSAFFSGSSGQSEGGFPAKVRRGNERVHILRDRVLVMGTDEEECFKYTTAAIWIMTTKPWRLEVDLWKSFGNVDLRLLEGLDGAWFDG